ncbi:MAG: nucleotidyltransferase domain-containing protein [Calditrichaeota bacterium]|nr:MAG: nucleotidyltransferase domain-containing protein [Calditrichota bacterium]
MSYRAAYYQLIDRLVKRITDFYGDRLVSLAVFGSVARDAFRPDSDIDILIVATDLPKGRIKRVREFESHIEIPFEEEIKSLFQQGIHPFLSPIIKTPEEVALGSPLFLDMTEDVLIYFDRKDFLKNHLQKFSQRLQELGAKKVPAKGGYYWILKPDYQPGEVIEL